MKKRSPIYVWVDPWVTLARVPASMEEGVPKWCNLIFNALKIAALAEWF